MGICKSQLLNLDRNMNTDNSIQVYYMFHRQYMHRMLMDSALGEGEGPPAQLIVNHQVSHQIHHYLILQPRH